MKRVFWDGELMARSVRSLILVSLCLVPINLVFGDDPATPSGPTTITIAEAEALLNLVPVIQDLRAKGIIVKSDVQSVSTMNNKDYYFFWIYNATAQKQRDIGSISVGNYAVNKHTADVRVWQVSNDVFHGDDGVLVATSELA